MESEFLSMTAGSRSLDTDLILSFSFFSYFVLFPFLLIDSVLTFVRTFFKEKKDEKLG